MKFETALATYRMSDATAQLVRSTSILLIAGIVGSGKNTVINELLKSGDYHKIVSHTTRVPRQNHGLMEQDGVDYHFMTLKRAEELIEAEAFVEAKYVHGNVYGTSVVELKAAHDNSKVAVTDIDIQGVVEYLDIKPDAHAIFLLPPSVETWLGRLGKRYGDLAAHRDEINKRFKTAYQEIGYALRDQRFILVVNDDLETTVMRIEQIVSGKRNHTSDFAQMVTEHLLAYIDHHLRTSSQQGTPTGTH